MENSDFVPLKRFGSFNPIDQSDDQNELVRIDSIVEFNFFFL